MAGNIHFDYNGVEQDLQSIKNSKNNIDGILNVISSIYGEINASPVFSGTAAAAYQDTFEELKANAFIRVPEKIEDISSLIGVAKERYKQTETTIARSANGEVKEVN